MKPMQRTALLLPISLVLTSCATNPSIVPDPSEILDKTWQLESVQRANAAAVEVIHPEKFTFRLGSDGHTGMLVSCNQCGGDYELEGATLEASRFACTLALCAPTGEHPSVDSSFPDLIEGTSQLSLENGRLVLSSSRGTLRFRR